MSIITPVYPPWLEAEGGTGVPSEKLCECGCGNKAPIAKQTNEKIGHVKGRPVRFILGHVHYRGGRATHSKGYNLIRMLGHPRADKRGYVFEHILVVEEAIGKSLPPGACVHHFDENPKNNSPSNLLVCPDNAYHRLIHQRTRSWKACGNPSWRLCRFCKKYDAIQNLYINPANNSGSHHECSKVYQTNNRDHFNAMQRMRRQKKRAFEVNNDAA